MPTASRATLAPLQDLREHHLRPRRAIGRLGEQLEIAEELIGALGAEHRAIDEDEVLGPACGTGQAFAVDIEDLERKPAWQSDRVGQDIAGVGRHSEVHTVLARRGEEPLREFGGQVAVDRQRSFKHTVRLGVDRADGVPIISGGFVEDLVECLDQLGDRLLLVGLDILDRRIVTDGHRHRAFSFLSPC